MSHAKLSSKRRTHAIVAATATLGLLGAMPALATPTARANSMPTTASATTHGDKIPANLRLYQTRTSLLGVHRWYQQISDGHPVVGGWYAQHTLKAAGGTSSVSVWDGRQQVQRLTDTTATVSAADATADALSAAKAPTTPTGNPSLWVLPGNANGSRLAGQSMPPTAKAPPPRTSMPRPELC
ncbi:MAG: hypothetical protein ACR2KG_11490 [Nocardioidaceae bacterium]